VPWQAPPSTAVLFPRTSSRKERWGLLWTILFSGPPFLLRCGSFFLGLSFWGGLVIDVFLSFSPLLSPMRQARSLTLVFFFSRFFFLRRTCPRFFPFSVQFFVHFFSYPYQDFPGDALTIIDFFMRPFFLQVKSLPGPVSFFSHSSFATALVDSLSDDASPSGGARVSFFISPSDAFFHVRFPAPPFL